MAEKCISIFSSILGKSALAAQKHNMHIKLFAIPMRTDVDDGICKKHFSER